VGGVGKNGTVAPGLRRLIGLPPPVARQSVAAMQEALVSICMPCYNAEKYVAEALESALGQTWPKLEIIVVNDGSTDGSREVLRRFEARGVRVIDQKNRGKCVAANRAFAESKGEYIKFLDADDLISSDMVALQMARMRPGQMKVAESEWGRFYKDDPATFLLSTKPDSRDMNPVDWLVENFMDAGAMMQCGMYLIPRALLERTGGWDERLTLLDDFEFFCRVLTASDELLHTTGARLYYRSGLGGSLSRRNDDRSLTSGFESLSTGIQWVLAKRSDPRARLACANVIQSFIYSYYPRRPDLLAKADAKVKELGGSNLKIEATTPLKIMSFFLGWKLGRRIQILAGRH
jgi:GT2 family glycosyltransferase